LAAAYKLIAAIAQLNLSHLVKIILGFFTRRR
jgi:hypothetical protein